MNSQAARTPPLQLFLSLLAIIFIGELTIMFLLDRYLAGSRPQWLEASLDAGLLTAVCVPFFWRFFLKPLQSALDLESVKAQVAMETAAEGILALDESGNIRIFNRAAEHIFGYAENEVRGKNVLQLLSMFDTHTEQGRKHELAHYSGLSDTDIREAQGIRKDGTTFPVELAVSELRFAGAKLCTAIVRDITDRKRAQSEQDELRRNQQALLNAIQESALLMERQGRLLVINEVGAQRLKATPEELVGKNAYEILPPEVAQVRRARFEQIAERGIAETFEDERAGRRFVSTVYPIRDSAGETTRFAIYAADVTQQRRLQAIEELFPAINQQILQGLPLREVLFFVCQKVAEQFQLELVWVGRKEPAGTIRILASAGVASDCVNQLKEAGARWDDTPQGRGPAGSAIRLGQPQLFKVDDPRMQPWTQIALEYKLHAVLGIPLVVRGEIYGAVILCSSDPAFFDFPPTFNMLTAIATRISVALELAIDQQQVRLLGSALAAAGNAVMIADHVGCIQWVNPAFARLSGFTQEEAVGQSPRLLKSGQHTQEYYKTLWETITKGETWSGETIECNKDGSLYTVLQTITPIADDKGEITHFITIQEDITAQKLAQQHIQYLANFDALTSLPNRALFYDRLRQALVRAKRNYGGVTLLFLDLDGFKKVNDTLGHHIGDLVLVGVADRLRQCVRESDTVARLGGDEFTVILNETHEYDNVVKVAEKIIEAIAAPFVLEGHEAHVGVSIGIARYSEEASSEDELVNSADQAMYAAKSAGKNTYRFSFAA